MSICRCVGLLRYHHVGRLTYWHAYMQYLRRNVGAIRHGNEISSHQPKRRQR